ncbi:MAG: prenyltransferase/squalene oxidase repeat-containing protein [Planctomycetota bacterium]
MRWLALLLLAGVALAQEAPNLAREAPPAAKVTLDEAIRTAVDWLVANQNKSGSFGKPTSGRTWEVSAAIPGGLHAFRSATTSLCWMGLSDSPYQTDASRAAQERALKWLVKNARVKRADGGELYNIWSLGYGLQAITQAIAKKAPGATDEELRAAAAELVKLLGIYQSPEGGFGYYDFQTETYRPSWSTSFTTATCLYALHRAQDVGVTVPPKVITKARENLLICRRPDGSYLYGSYFKYAPNASINRAQGSSLRTQACNLALFLTGGPVDKAWLVRGLDDLVDQHRFAIAGLRRPIPHESHYAVSGYFYLYGQAYAGLVLDQLPPAERKLYAGKVAEFVLKARQPDGSYWDYPLYGYHKFYGTGYALMALSRCQAALTPRE